MQDYDIDGWLEAAYEERFEIKDDWPEEDNWQEAESFFEPDAEDDPE
jgi:hypothetical protein